MECKKSPCCAFGEKRLCNRTLNERSTCICSSENWIKPNLSRWIVDLTGFIRIGDKCVRSWTFIHFKASRHCQNERVSEIFWTIKCQVNAAQFANYLCKFVNAINSFTIIKRYNQGIITAYSNSDTIKMILNIVRKRLCIALFSFLLFTFYSLMFFFNFLL